jgi:hypothetical protein
LDGSRQRYLFPRRFLCRHFSILSLFSRASGLAEAGRATGIPRCCAQPSTLGSELSAATAARVQRSSLLCLPQANPCVLAVSRALQPLSSICTTFRACQHCHPLPSPSPSTNQPDTTLHSTQTSNATALSPAQIRDPARSALKRDIRALTSPPAWLAAVARCWTPFASTAT